MPPLCDGNRKMRRDRIKHTVKLSLISPAKPCSVDPLSKSRSIKPHSMATARKMKRHSDWVRQVNSKFSSISESQFLVDFLLNNISSITTATNYFLINQSSDQLLRANNRRSIINRTTDHSINWTANQSIDRTSGQFSFSYTSKCSPFASSRHP